MVCCTNESSPSTLRQPSGTPPQLPSVSMRLVDDFIFVTHSTAAARALAARLQAGQPPTRKLLSTDTQMNNPKFESSCQAGYR